MVQTTVYREQRGHLQLSMLPTISGDGRAAQTQHEINFCCGADIYKELQTRREYLEFFRIEPKTFLSGLYTPVIYTSVHFGVHSPLGFI
ncbi:hypothetical protein FKM82_019338 [Ascaphus truei]